MKKPILLLLVTLAILSCNKTTKNEKTITGKQIDSLSRNDDALKSETKSKKQNWYDELIADYIKKSNNELIKVAIKNNDRVEWLLDRTEKTDSINYYIFNIGHDVSDEDGSNPRFTSDGWIYVDSLSKKIYEYDLPNDSLIVWKNKVNR